VDAVLAIRPDVEVVLSSYDYPNFNVGFWCFLYACPKREDLSRDPDADLITDAEINALMVQVETLRRDWAAQWDRVSYDNSIGLMHHVYGDGVSPAWTLPRPGIEPALYEPFPGGNPLRPSLRSVFRRPNNIDADPIHLDFEGYQHKIGQQVLAHLLSAWRGAPDATVFATGSGWCDGVQATAGPVLVGDDGLLPRAGIVDLVLPAVTVDSSIEGAVLWLSRDGAGGANPFVTATPRVDLVQGWFGADPQVEPGDGTAPADLQDAAWVVGSAKADGYTVRLQLKPGALELLEGGSRAQLRLVFPFVDADASWVSFAGAGAGPPSRQDKATFAWVEDSTAPTLDLFLQQGTDAPPAGRAVARLLPNVPNPFNPRTALRFELDVPARVELRVHDLRGRRVRVLEAGELPAGTHVRIWDGRDASGRDVASGVYLAELRATGGGRVVTSSRALTLVR
jgi:hypothetical protein